MATFAKSKSKRARFPVAGRIDPVAILASAATRSRLGRCWWRGWGRRVCRIKGIAAANIDTAPVDRAVVDRYPEDDVAGFHRDVTVVAVALIPSGAQVEEDIV